MTDGPQASAQASRSIDTGVHLGDARELSTWLDEIVTPAAQVITATITSPPYGGLKNYGQRDQIGWAQPYEQYLADCREVLATLFDRTLENGSLWLVADSLRMPTGKNGPWRLEPLPFHLADEAAKAGWMLRDVAIWRKDRSVPWSGRGRMRNAFEYILQFVKSDDFKYHVDRIRNPSRLEEWWVRFPERYHPNGKVPSNVWDIPIPRQGAWTPTTAAPHACPLPAELIERIILLSTDAGDVVFDPFAGIGSVIAHAERLGRQGLGLESNKQYVDAYWTHVRPDVTAKTSAMPDDERAAMAADLTRTLVTLRVLKLPRVLYEAIRPSITDPEFAIPIALSIITRGRKLRTTPSDGVWANAEVIVAAEGQAPQRERLRIALVEAATRRPASKFGVSTSISVVPPRGFPHAVGRSRLHFYPRGRTWRCDGTITPEEAIKVGRANLNEARQSIPPILSNLHASEDPRPLG